MHCKQCNPNSVIFTLSTLIIIIIICFVLIPMRHTCTFDPLSHQSPHESGTVFTPVRPSEGMDLKQEEQWRMLVTNREQGVPADSYLIPVCSLPQWRMIHVLYVCGGLCHCCMAIKWSCWETFQWRHWEKDAPTLQRVTTTQPITEASELDQLKRSKHACSRTLKSIMQKCIYY